MSNGTNNKCFTCGKYGHFAKECKEVIWCCQTCDEEFPTEKECIIHEQNCSRSRQSSIRCFKCNQYGHYASECYAKRTRYNKSCDVCGKTGHLEVNCWYS